MVTATAGSASGTAGVTVAQKVSSVAVSPMVQTISPGDTVRLAAEALDANGHLVEGAEFGWSSSDGSVAAVDPSGLVTGLAEGRVTVEAAAGDVLGTSRITVAGPELAALLDLHDATGGAEWGAALGWSLEVPVSEWRGVETDSAGAVTGLSLSGVGMAGELPETLGNLVRLESIDLSDNNLTGSIPHELGTPPGLRVIDLSGNDLTGEIPAALFVRPPVQGNASIQANAGGTVGGARNTRPVSRAAGRRGYALGYDALDLSHNQLTGPIPRWMGNDGDRGDRTDSRDRHQARRPPPDARLRRAHAPLDGGQVFLRIGCP